MAKPNSAWARRPRDVSADARRVRRGHREGLARPSRRIDHVIDDEIDGAITNRSTAGRPYQLVWKLPTESIILKAVRRRVETLDVAPKGGRALRGFRF